MTTIIFIRIKEEKKNEISGYIDLNHRLKTEDFKLIFEKKKMTDFRLGRISAIGL